MIRMFYLLSVTALYIVIISQSEVSVIVNGKDISSYCVVGVGFLLAIMFLETLLHFISLGKKKDGKNQD